MKMTKQLRVTTRTAAKMQKTQKIIDALRRIPDSIGNPKSIAFEANLNENTVKDYIRNIKEIKKGRIKGTYCLVGEKVDGILKMVEPKIHNEIITNQINNYFGKGEKEIWDYEFIKYKLTINKQGKVTLRRLAVDGVQLPIEIPFIIGVCKRLKEKIKSINQSEPTNKEVIFTNIEINQDFKKTRLEGANCVTLEGLYLIYKVYQKGEDCRLEAKSGKGLQMTEEALIQVLEGNQNTLELYKISQDILTRLEDLEKSNDKTNMLINHIYKILFNFGNNSPVNETKSLEREVIKTSFVKSSKIIKKELRAIKNIFEETSGQDKKTDEFINNDGNQENTAADKTGIPTEYGDAYF